jgi:PAS domain S-box-containing protein
MKSSRERLRETNFARVRSDLASPFLSSIVESSEDAIVSKSLDGIIASWNRAAERMFGYSASEAVGKHISLIIPPERRAEEDDVLGQIRRGQKVEHF